MNETNQNSKSEKQAQKGESKSGNGFFSRPVVFGLGFAASWVLRAASPALGKLTEPLVTGAVKQGIRITRAARSSGGRVGASLADNYARARFELEQEERTARKGSNSPRIVKLAGQSPEDDEPEREAPEGGPDNKPRPGRGKGHDPK